MDNIEGEIKHPFGVKSTVATLVPTKSDAEIAEEIKREIVEIMPPIFALLDKAKALGFIIQYGVGQDAFGRHCITSLIVAKHY